MHLSYFSGKWSSFPDAGVCVNKTQKYFSCHFCKCFLIKKKMWNKTLSPLLWALTKLTSVLATTAMAKEGKGTKCLLVALSSFGKIKIQSLTFEISLVP